MKKMLLIDNMLKIRSVCDVEAKAPFLYHRKYNILLYFPMIQKNKFKLPMQNFRLCRNAYGQTKRRYFDRRKASNDAALFILSIDYFSKR